MNAAQVRAKARAAQKRREDEVEQEEIEGGEINLVPYLDIVTNLMLFLLASVSSGFILGQINTTLPDHAPASSQASTDPAKKPDEQPLGIMVSMTKNRLYLWSVSGLEGTLQEPKLSLGLLPPKEAGEAPSFDYKQLNQALIEIATRRWGGKLRPMDTYEILLQADGDIPYETIINVMDYMRRPIPQGVHPLPIVTLPKFEIKEGKQVPVEKYDPEKHFLFDDVLFAKPSFD
jgi:biopolymer transport protein ExbD